MTGTGHPYRYRIATFEESQILRNRIGMNPPEIRELQFWYRENGDLLMVLTVPESKSEFATVQTVEIRRAIVDVYPRRAFERFTYAFMLLDHV